MFFNVIFLSYVADFARGHTADGPVRGVILFVSLYPNQGKRCKGTNSPRAYQITLKNGAFPFLPNVHTKSRRLPFTNSNSLCCAVCMTNTVAEESSLPNATRIIR